VKDLTEHSIGKHILQMAAPTAAGMLFQTLYFLIDLYFVARLGDAALAGVHVPAVLSSASRIVSFAVPALWPISPASRGTGGGGRGGLAGDDNCN
jgi:Na+-driven multidrug efflux pump